MPRPIPADVTPEVLAWARKSAGLSVEAAARKAGVSPELILAWEEGTAQPTINQCRALAKAYKRPLAVFFLPSPPRDFEAMRDFRRLPGTTTHDLSTELRFAIREAIERRQAALELLEYLSDGPPTFNLQVSMDQDPEQVASEILRHLGFAEEHRLTWNSPAAALDYWISAVEKLGILVFQVPKISISEMRGFSISDTPLPVIALNRKDAPTGRIFTLLHELVHIAINRAGLCNLELPDDSSDYRRIEWFCNRVAAAILMPRSALLSHEIVRSKPTSYTDWSDRELKRIAKHFKVSKESVLLRLVDLGRSTVSYYQSKREQFLREYEEYESAKKERSGPPVPHHEKVLAYNGRLYTSLVFEAYYDQEISLNHVCSLLGVKTKHLRDLEQAVFA